MSPKPITVKTEVEITLGRSSGSGSEPWFLRVTDRRSRMDILQVRLSNDAFADMMSSSLAGNLGRAEVTQSPWIGKYADHASRPVEAGFGHGPELDQDMAAAGRRLLREDEVLRQDRRWIYSGYQGGGGGSKMRTLVFVRFLDEPLEKD